MLLIFHIFLITPYLFTNGVHFNVKTKTSDYGKSCKTPRLRKEFTSMTLHERRRFIQTYIKASTQPPYKRRYQYLVKLHQKLFKKIHSEKQFFPWHRWYLLQFENLLLLINPHVTLPYWDWSICGNNIWETGVESVWSGYPWGLGGNGTGVFNCVEDGPFSKERWRLTPSSGGGCLRRNFTGQMPEVRHIYRTLQLKAREFRKFEDRIQLDHNELHCCIQGTMELRSASNTPEFLLHHVFIDKLWYDWQNKGMEYRWMTDGSLNAHLAGSHYRVYHFMDASNLGHTGIKVIYRDLLPWYKHLRAKRNYQSALDEGQPETPNRCCPRKRKEAMEREKKIEQEENDIQIEAEIDY